jgi:membrane protease subunit (stomatin/prohibitin family)
MAIIDFVKWNANPSILAWKFPSEELSTWTQLIVNETQEAYLVKGGVYQGPFGPGRYVLSTENIPVIRELMGIPFGGSSPFTAEVWFVNRVTNLAVRWGTNDPIQLEDPKYKLMVPVRAFGQYGIRVVEPKKFLLKLVGTLPAFDVASLATYFNGVFLTRIVTIISASIIKSGQSVFEVAPLLETLSDKLKIELTPEMAEYGVELVQFNIHSINVPETDPAVKTLKAALAQRAEMNLLGVNYQQQRAFDVLQVAAGNEGVAGSVMGAGMGVGMGAGMGLGLGGAMGNSVAGALGQLLPQNPIGPAADQHPCPKCHAPNGAGTRFCGACGGELPEIQNAQALACDKCNAAIPKGSKFCPACGDPVHACPQCGEDNNSGTLLCRKCGSPFPVACPHCQAQIPGTAKFCPECGEKVGAGCRKCSAEIVPGAKFCSVCGEAQ